MPRPSVTRTNDEYDKNENNNINNYIINNSIIFRAAK